MKVRHPYRLAICGLFGAGMLLPGACVWRTEHKVETTSKIEAHIVLDIRQVKDEGAAVENYVRGETDTPPADTATKPTSALRVLPTRPWLATFDFNSNAAAAMPVSFNTQLSAQAAPDAVATEDEKKSAIERRRGRAGQIEQLLNKKQLGENDHGYLTVRPGGKDLKDLVQAENADRKIIYQAIAEKHGAGKQLEPVEVLMAETIREKLKAGQLFQVPRGKESFDSFQKSALGKKYSDAKPGDWLEKK